MDAEEDEGNATSVLDTELDASTGEETDISGHPHQMASTEGIIPCKESITGHAENSANLRIDG